MDTSTKQTLFPGDQDPTDDVPYRQSVRILMFLMVFTRPDFAFVIGKLPQFCEKPLKLHLVAVKRVLRYISGTRDIGIQYWRDPKP